MAVAACFLLFGVTSNSDVAVSIMSPFHPLRFDMEVPADGRIELRVPLPAASRVTVYVVEAATAEFDDLRAASSTSTDFWDNPEDDEDWNDA